MLNQSSSANFTQSSFFASSAPSLSKSLRDSNSSFNTAKFLGRIKANASSGRVRFSGILDRSDQVDFFRVDVAPGASFSTATTSGKVKGGRIRINSYYSPPGQSPIKYLSVVFRPGSYSQEASVPLFNNFDSTIQVYAEVQSLSRNRTIRYSAQSLFR